MTLKVKEILNLALPSIVSNITVPLLGLVDLYIVGHIGNETYISAIAVGSMIFNIIYWVLGFLRMGTSGMTSQAYGKKSWDDTLRVLLRALTIGFCMGILFILFQRFIEWSMVLLMGTPISSVSLVSIYFRITIWGAPAMLGLYGLTGWFIGMQNTKVPMIIAIVQNITNILASLFFVFVLDWQIKGVAAGTMIAQWTGFLMGLYILRKSLYRKSIFNSKRNEYFSLRFIRSTLSYCGAWKHFFTVNRDIFLRTLCLVAVNMFFTSAGGRQGAMILAVNTLLMTLFTLFSYVMDGFAYAGEALSGKYYGAKDKEGFSNMLRQLFCFGMGMVVFFTAVYVLGGLRFLRFLTDDAAVIIASKPYLPWACLIPIAGVSAFIYDGIFIGMTETKGMLISSLVAMLCFFGFYFLTTSLMGNHALWIAFLIFLSFRGILQYFWADLYLFKRFETDK
ncbi:UNVERIFIED_CONTAM: MATE family efflux transporter [Prevotella sp. 15_C9]